MPVEQGDTFRHQSVSFSASAAACAYADVHMPTCLCGTIFDRAVVPDVGNNIVVSLALTGWSCRHPQVPASVKDRPPGRRRSTAPLHGRPARAPAPRWGVKSSRREQCTRVQISQNGLFPPYAGFSGAHAALAATVRIRYRHSGPFGSTTAYRVMTAYPHRPAAGAPSPMCRKRRSRLSGARPGARIAGAPGIRRA